MSAATAGVSFEHGPVEVFVIEFEGDSPDPGVLDAILRLTSGGVIRLLDLVIASRDAAGGVTISEVTEAGGAGAGSELVGIELGVQGLLGEEDIAEAMATVDPGLSIALVACEHRWATELAERLTAARGRVVRSERIPAAAVNQLVRDHVVTEA